MPRLHAIVLKLDADCDYEPCRCRVTELVEQLQLQRTLFEAVDEVLAELCCSPARRGRFERVSVVLDENSNISDRQLVIRMLPSMFPSLRNMGCLTVVRD